MERLKRGIKKIAERQKMINNEVIEKTIGYILAALGFVVALAWNDAIKNFIEYLFPLNKNSIVAKFIYALMLTLIIVAATIILTRRAEEGERKEEEKK